MRLDKRNAVLVARRSANTLRRLHVLRKRPFCKVFFTQSKCFLLPDVSSRVLRRIQAMTVQVILAADVRGPGENAGEKRIKRSAAED